MPAAGASLDLSYRLRNTVGWGDATVTLTGPSDEDEEMVSIATAVTCIGISKLPLILIDCGICSETLGVGMTDPDTVEAEHRHLSAHRALALPPPPEELCYGDPVYERRPHFASGEAPQDVPCLECGDLLGTAVVVAKTDQPIIDHMCDRHGEEPVPADRVQLDPDVDVVPALLDHAIRLGATTSEAGPVTD